MTDKIKSYSKYLPFVVLAALGLAIYFNTLFNGYIYDDYQLILDDFRIKDIKYIPQIFLSSEWSFSGTDVINNYYRPLYVLIFMVEWHIFADQLWGWHLTNIIFHIISAFIVFLLFKALLSDDNEQSAAGDGASPTFSTPALAFMGSLIFLTHPVITESVAWASAMSELSFSLFYLLSFYLYIRSQSEKSRKLYAVSVLSFLLAAFAKETAMTLPVLIVAFDLFIKRRNLLKQIPLYIPFAVVGLFYLTLRIIVLEGMAPKANMHPYLNTYQYILNAFPLIIDYIGILLVPLKLRISHLLRPVYSLGEFRTLATLTVSLAISVSLILLRKRSALYTLCLFLFIIPLLPALYIPVLDHTPLAERYIYLPSAAFALLIVLILRESRRAGNLKRPIIVAFIVLISIYSALGVQRNFEWKDMETLLRAGVREDPENYYLLGELGNELNRAGNPKEATDLFKRSIAGNLAMRDRDPAILGSARLGLAQAYRSLKKNKEAKEQYMEVLKMAPGHYGANFEIALIYHEERNYKMAVAYYKEAFMLSKEKDEKTGILINIGNIFARTGRFKEAKSIYLKALALSPGEPMITRNLAIVEKSLK